MKKISLLLFTSIISISLISQSFATEVKDKKEDNPIAIRTKENLIINKINKPIDTIEKPLLITNINNNNQTVNNMQESEIASIIYNLNSNKDINQHIKYQIDYNPELVNQLKTNLNKFINQNTDIFENNKSFSNIAEFTKNLNNLFTQYLTPILVDRGIKNINLSDMNDMQKKKYSDLLRIRAIAVISGNLQSLSSNKIQSFKKNIVAVIGKELNNLSNSDSIKENLNINISRSNIKIIDDFLNPFIDNQKYNKKIFNKSFNSNVDIKDIASKILDDYSKYKRNEEINSKINIIINFLINNAINNLKNDKDIENSLDMLLFGSLNNN